MAPDVAGVLTPGGVIAIWDPGLGVDVERGAVETVGADLVVCGGREVTGAGVIVTGPVGAVRGGGEGTARRGFGATARLCAARGIGCVGCEEPLQGQYHHASPASATPPSATRRTRAEFPFRCGTYPRVASTASACEGRPFAP